MNPTRTDYKISDFLEWQRGGQLELSPSFQRRSVWRKGAKSFLLDTILKGYPTPPVFLRDLPTNLDTLKSRREVVDGQQRLRTVLAFVDPRSIPDFDSDTDDFVLLKAHDPSLAGMRFPDLNEENRQAILDYKFSVTVFPADTEDQEILDVFARMNATGVSLNSQELRNAKYYGDFKSCSYRTATKYLDFWVTSQLFTHNQIARMKEVEFASDLLILIISGITEKSKNVIDRYYSEYDEILPERTEIEKRFEAVMEVIIESSPDMPAAFSKTTMFYALFACIYDGMWGLESPISKAKRRSVSTKQIESIFMQGKKIETGSAPAGVLKAATTRTTHASSRSAIVGFLGR